VEMQRCRAGGHEEPGIPAFRRTSPRTSVDVPICACVFQVTSLECPVIETSISGVPNGRWAVRYS
ncbi:hypothetical protein BDN71DRAFT_1454759, partial [Pleurotus eryngii]